MNFLTTIFACEFIIVCFMFINTYALSKDIFEDEDTFIMLFNVRFAIKYVIAQIVFSCVNLVLLLFINTTIIKITFCAFLVFVVVYSLNLLFNLRILRNIIFAVYISQFAIDGESGNFDYDLFYDVIYNNNTYVYANRRFIEPLIHYYDIKEKQNSDEIESKIKTIAVEFFKFVKELNKNENLLI